MVAREGSAPPISGCRPDVILFHQRAETGCRGWICTSISAFKGRCPTIRRPGKWWPARVTLPVQRLKRPLHHFNACRPKIGGMPWTRTTLPIPGAHCLANRPGPLVRLTFQIGLPSRSSESEGWCPWQDLHLHCRRFELRASALGYTGDSGAPGQICTDTARGLSPSPLRWATGAACTLRAPARQGRFKDTIGLASRSSKRSGERRLVPREGVPPPTSPS